MPELIIEPDISKPQDIRKARNVGIVSVLTVIVALFGYLREATLAARFGVSATMDAYFSAIFIPTMVYMVLIAGTLSPVFIPILLQEDANEDRAKLSETFSTITNFVMLFLTAIVSCALIAAPKWLHVLFPGFSEATMEMTVHLVYIIFPAVLFIAMAGLLTAVLNGFGRFALAAFAPALSSITVIVAALFARGNGAVYVVGFATAVGFLLQLLLLIMPTASLGIRYRPTLHFRHPAITRLLRLGTPLLLYLVVANGSLFLERNLASQLSTGAVSTLTYAMRLFSVPANFLAAPLAIVCYPQFAREALRDKYGDLRNQVSRMFRVVLFLFLPVTVFTMLNAEPLTRTLFERGQFRLQDSVVTAQVLMLYGIGIFPNAIAVILLRCFYAVQDTVTPLVAEIINLAFYASVAGFFTRQFGIRGLAFTRGLSFFFVTAILVSVLSYKRRLLTIDLDLLRLVAKTIFACLVMAAVSWLTLSFLQSIFDSGNAARRLGIVFLVLVTSSTAFLWVARLLKVREAADILTAAVGLLSWS